MFGPFWALATSRVGGVGAAAAIALINSVGNTGGFVGPYAGRVHPRSDAQLRRAGLVLVGAILAVVPFIVLVVDED